MFVFEGNAPPIYLNAFMFTLIIWDPASPTEEASIFMNVAKVYSVMRKAHHSMEERGGVSRAH